MEELINSNLWASVGEVHLAQTTVEGTGSRHGDQEEAGTLEIG